MRDDEARKLDHATLEAPRIGGVGLVQKGERPELVGKALGLNRTTIYNWLEMYRRRGARKQQLFSVAPYATDTNPDALVWKHLKAGMIGRMTTTYKAGFKREVGSATRKPPDVCLFTN